MADLPILMAKDMASATWDGRKTVTRRLVREQTSLRAGPDGVEVWTGFMGWQPLSAVIADPGACANAHRPPYVPGNRLWVRENFAIVPATAYRMSEGVPQTLDPEDSYRSAIYAAGWERCKPGPWRPSIHMPRWASRMTLPVTDVRAERLQDITEEDAQAEGPSLATDYGRLHPTYRLAFANLWDSLSPDGRRWDDNPWVWRVQFTVERRNIDAARAA